MEERNAIIKSARLEIEDHGFLTGFLYLDYGGMEQGFGGYALYSIESFKKNKKQPNFTGHFIQRCMEIAGVYNWSELKGKTIRVRADHNSVKAVGHIVKDDWFYPADDFKKMDSECS